jgi:hypothetical protein
MMRRREVTARFCGAAAASPFAARAQQHSIPVVGFLCGQSMDAASSVGERFRQV